VAENYPTKDETLGAGEVVSLDKDNAVFVKRSSSAYDSNLVGVISTEPAVLLGGFKTSQSQFKDEIQVPVTLSGRVPVKVSLESGEIKIGDALTSSSQPGIAMKATEPGRVIGIALESFPKEGQDPSASSGQVMVFINSHWSLGSLADDGSLSSTSSEQAATEENQPTILDQFTLAVKKSLEKLGLLIKDSIVKVKELVAEKITAKKLCLEGDDGETICVDKNQLEELLMISQSQNINGSNGSTGGSDGSTGGLGDGSDDDLGGGGEPPPQCDATHLSSCATETDCQSAGGYWYNETCNAEPELEQPVVEEAEPEPEPEPEPQPEPPDEQPQTEQPPVEQ
ncbi:MAG: hypothetical protein Q8N73_00160, partial [bacterium]|nr:hypothetical protein [bacterium]